MCIMKWLLWIDWQTARAGGVVRANTLGTRDGRSWGNNATCCKASLTENSAGPTPLPPAALTVSERGSPAAGRWLGRRARRTPRTGPAAVAAAAPQTCPPAGCLADNMVTVGKCANWHANASARGQVPSFHFRLRAAADGSGAGMLLTPDHKRIACLALPCSLVWLSRDSDIRYQIRLCSWPSCSHLKTMHPTPAKPT